jgi:hypothetical protein
VIFYGPHMVAALLVVIAIITWRRNLGPTPVVWALIGSAILLVFVGLIFPIGIWLGDI